MRKCKLCNNLKFFIVKEKCYICKLFNNLNYCNYCREIKKCYDQVYCDECFYKIIKSKL